MASSVKDRLLETAARLFYRQGYNLTGINQILAEADVAIGSLYKHYPSKVDLLIAYLEKANDIYFTGLNNQMNKAAAPKDKLHAFFDFHIQFQIDGDFLGCNFMKINAEIAREEPRVQTIVQAHKRQVRTILLTQVSALPAQTSTPQEQTSIPRTQSNISWNTELLTDNIYLLFEGAMVDTTIHRDLHYLYRAKEILNKLT